MNYKGASSNLLNALREQADEVAARREQQRELSREVVDRVDQRLHLIFRYFDEACGLLQVIRPAVNRRFTLPEIVTYTDMSLDQAQVTFRKLKFQEREIYDYVVVYYSLAGPVPAPLRVASRNAAEVERSLLSANIEYRADRDTSIRGAATHNVIHVAPGLRCEVRFEPDFANERITVTLRNVDRLESALLEFQPDKLDAAALDDLVNLMLGKPSQFLLRAPLRGFNR
jgi:hypothetical protein